MYINNLRFVTPLVQLMIQKYTEVYWYLYFGIIFLYKIFWCMYKKSCFDLFSTLISRFSRASLRLQQEIFCGPTVAT